MSDTKQLSSPVFTVTGLDDMLRELRGKTTKPFPADSPLGGAYAFYGPNNIRFIVQYDIQTDTDKGRFDVLVED